MYLLPVLLGACGGDPLLPSVPPSAALAEVHAARDPHRPAETVPVVVVPQEDLPLAARDPASPVLRDLGRTGAELSRTVTLRTGEELAIPGFGDLQVTRLAGGLAVALPPVCDVPVRFRATDGRALAGEVAAHVAQEVPGPALARLDAAAGGTLRLPCDRDVALVFSGPGGRSVAPSGRASSAGALVQVRPTSPPTSVEVPLAPSVRLEVVVTDPEGRPVADAWVANDGLGTFGVTPVDADGRAVLWDRVDELVAGSGALGGLRAGAPGRAVVRGSASTSVFADAHGLAGDWTRWTRGPDGWRVDVTLPPVRLVEVRCEGLTPETCAATEAACVERAPLGQSPTGRCFAPRPDLLVCPCVGEGDVPLHLPGARLRVPAGADAVAVDFRQWSGGVRGVVGKSTCTVTAKRLPSAWEVLDGRGGFEFLERSARCEDGRFRVEGLPPGRWMVEVTSASGLKLPSAMVDVGRDVVDLGERYPR